MTIYRLCCLLALLMPVPLLFSQSDLGFSYQSVVRDGGGALLSNQSVGIDFVIHSGSGAGPVIYHESHSLTSNQSGLVTTTIGEGAAIIGTWDQLDWADDLLFLEVRIDGISVSNERLEAVPFAKVATGMTSRDLQDISPVPAQSGEVLKWDGSEWIPSVDEGGPTYTAGSGISLNGTKIVNNAPDKVVTLTGSGATNISGTYPSFTISSTDNVNDADADPANEIQTLSISGTDLSLSNGGGFVTIPQKTYIAGNGITINGNVIKNAGDKDATDDITITTAASGDLLGTFPAPQVVKLRGIQVSSGIPAQNQVLTYSGSKWKPLDPPMSPWEENGANISYTGGNTGIGITTPVDRLQIHTAGTGSSSFRMTNSTTGLTNSDGFWLGYSSANAAYVYNFESSPIIFGTGSAERMRITQTGELGIGTINPSARFEVVHNSTSSNPQLLLSENQSSDFARVHFKNTSGSTTWSLGGKTASQLSSAVFEVRHSTTGAMLTIKPDGHIGLLTDSPDGDLHLKQTSTFWASGAGLIFEENGSSVDHWQMLHTGLHFSYVENGTRRAYIEAATGNWVQPSDLRLKSEVEPIADVLERVQRLRPVSYKYHDQSENQRTIGFLAQEVVVQFPELKHESEDGYLGLAYRDFGILAIKAIQEQQLLIETQRTELQELQNQLDRQGAEIAEMRLLLRELSAQQEE